MNLTRCADQSETLEAFYAKLGEETGHAHAAGARAMVGLVARLRLEPFGREVFGLTSHARLCLLASDSYRSPWYVIVSALDQRNYLIEYLMPAVLAPWPGAYVRGEAQSEDEAVRMVRTAMDKSGGWNVAAS